MLKRILYDIFSFIYAYGCFGFLTLFIKVSWKQDVNFANNGYDLWTFKPHEGYFTGTYSERNNLYSIK
jgi:hypothetical protein